MDAREKSLLVAIPALNESKTIGGVIQSIPSSITGIAAVSIVVIDDGSTDATSDIARASGADVIVHGENRGVGAAFRTALKEARSRKADILVQMDGDGQFNPLDIPKLIQPLLRNDADIAMCTRFSDRTNYPNMPRIKIWGNHIVRYIINFVTNKRFTDVSNGFRAYNREAILRLTLFGNFTYTHEAILDAASKQLRIQEISLTVRGEREHGSSRVARNIITYAIQWLAIFFRALRDMMPFQVFGIAAAIVGVGGIGSGIFVFIHWLSTGQTFPYRSVILLSILLILLSAFLFTVALLADMLRRQRQLLDELLYYWRASQYDKKDE